MANALKREILFNKVHFFWIISKRAKNRNYKVRFREEYLIKNKINKLLLSIAR